MDETSFANVFAVVDYLRMRGWRIKKSAVYSHIRQGKLLPEADGTFRVRAVDKYARLFLKKIGEGQSMSAGLDKLHEKRLKADTEKLEGQAEYWKIKAKIEAGLYVEKATFERELALRAIIFRQGIKSFIFSRTPDLINKANGDPKLVPDVMNYLEEQTDDWLTVYSKPQKFDVIIGDDEIEGIKKEADSEEEPDEEGK